ncbi:hypothetical protein [Streptomyces sp. NPDC001978]|uniref:hypothetical protein n=1 Tax=Streptomyces sp. NPDC001978 TaxID=3364627 RepID=UPI00367821D0
MTTPNPTTMPGALRSPAGAVAKLIVDLAEVADDGKEISLDVADTIAALTQSYAALVSAQSERKATK